MYKYYLDCEWSLMTLNLTSKGGARGNHGHGLDLWLSHKTSGDAH